MQKIKAVRRIPREVICFPTIQQPLHQSAEVSRMSAKGLGHLWLTGWGLCCYRSSQFAEQVLKGSPFALGMSPAAADPAKCAASLDGAVGSGRRVEAGKELSVTVQLRDRFGNVTEQAGALVVVVFKLNTAEDAGRKEQGLAGLRLPRQLTSVVLHKNGHWSVTKLCR